VTTSAWTSPTSDKPAADTSPAASSTPAAASAPLAASWYPDPTGRHEQRYWDGTRWTDHVSTGGQTKVDALDGSTARTADVQQQQQRQTVTTGASSGAAPFSGGVYAALIIATVLLGIVGVIVGAINLKHPARRGQAQVLLVLGIIVIVVYVLASASGG
jgi:hypothetical protein